MTAPYPALCAKKVYFSLRIGSSSQIAAEGLVEEGLLQLVEGVQFALVEGFEPLVS